MKTTIPNLKDLTDAQLEIIIAEHCGLHQSRGCWWKGSVLSDWPRYTTSLDAMHEAVKQLNDQGRHAYSVLLAMEAWSGGWVDWRDTLAVSEATAKQRAQVFVIAIGKAIA